MGHNRLGKIPTTRRWKAIVQSLSSSDSINVAPADEIDKIAAESLTAAEHALKVAIEDRGLRTAFLILTQVAECAKSKDWESSLNSLGVETANCRTALELSFAIQDAIDDRIDSTFRPSDVSEIAKQAAGAALHSLFQGHQLNLLGDNKSSIGSAIRTISTKNGYSELGHTFFSQFLSRFLNFYLSRATADVAGGERILQTGDISAFNEALESHCRQSAYVVRDFCGSWFSKTSYKEGFTPKNTEGFLAVALNKLSNELSRQGQSE